MKHILKGTAVTEFVEQFSRRILSASRHRELSLFQWSALRYYSGAYREARTIQDFAAAHSVSRRRALQIVRQLRRKRLLKSYKSPALAQVARIEITAAGVRLLRRDPQALIQAAVASLSAAERRALLTALKRASSALSRLANRVTQLCLFIGAGMLGYAGSKGQQTQNAVAQSAYEVFVHLT